MTQTTFTELARRIYDLPNGQLLHFKTSGGNDTEFYGVTRLDLFECDTILLSLYGGHNTSAFDASVDYDAASIESWLKDVVEAGACDAVYLMDNAEVFPDRHELWGVTFAAISSDGQPYRTQAVSEVSLFDSEAQAQDWIDCQEGGPYDSGFPAEDCSDPRPVLIDRWDVKQSKCEPVKHDSQPPSYWYRILGLRDELTGRITALLQKHHLQTIDIPDDSFEELTVRLQEWQREVRDLLIRTLREHGGRISFTPRTPFEEYPVTTSLSGQHDDPRIDISDLYLEGDTILADGYTVGETTRDHRKGFSIFNEHLSDAFSFVKHVIHP